MLEHEMYKGLWWIPENEDGKLTGDLTVRKGKAELEVIGDFGRELLAETARVKSYSPNLADQPRVLGISVDGKPITLEMVSERGHSVNLPGLPISKYGAGVALIGKHFEKGESVTFDEIAISATDLNTWTRVSGFNTSLGFEELEDSGSHAFTTIDIRYEAPDEIRIPLSRGEEIIIKFTAPAKGLWGRGSHVELTQEAALHFRFAKRASLQEVFERVSQIRNFLSLAVGRPVSVLSVSGYQDDYKREGSSSLRPIQLYWQIPHNPEPSDKSRDISEMLFTLEEAKPEMSTAMGKWFLKQARLEPVFNLFFGTLYHPNLYLEVKFLAYAQAIETYDYRRRRKPTSKTLAQRAYDVLAQCRTVAKSIVGPGQDDLDAFVRDFKDTRNYYTHYNPKLERKAARGTALLLLSIQLQAVIEMILLRELGFPCRAIDGILERANRYAQIRHFRSLAASEGKSTG
jgi:hypothetical protein